MITATAWVPRGFASPFPTKYTFDEEEFQRIAELAKLQLDEANDDLVEARNIANGNGADTLMDEDNSDNDAPAKNIKSKGFVSEYSVQNPLLSLLQGRGRRPQGI
jgi:periodic tryptophan protein 1